MVTERTQTDRVERVYRAESERLLRMLIAFSRDRVIAEDAVAEAFAQAIRRGEEIEDVRAWVWRAAYRIASADLKARGRTSDVATTEGYEVEPPAVDLVAALAHLSPKQRAAVLLHHYAGYSVREVAAIVDSTSGAVRVHLSVGRRRLRSYLEDDGLEDDDG